MKELIIFTLIGCAHCSIIVLRGTNKTSADLAALDSLSGLLQTTDTKQFLACDMSSCWFTSDQDSALNFNRETGNDGQYEFVVQSGSYSGLCLDREHCHSSTSNARLSTCDHCGSYHWQLGNDGRLAEDHNANCIQNDGSIRHCSDSFQAIEFYSPQAPFNPPQGYWQLAATTVSGVISQSVAWGTSSSDTNARTTTWAESLSASFKEGVIFESAKITATVSHSIATTMSSTFTQSVTSTCQVTCAQNIEKPFTFLYQWYTESTHKGGSDITKATSCNYMCIYNDHGEAIKPKCALTCCYDVDCQTCNPECSG